MAEFFSAGLAPLLLTLLAYELGVLLQKKTRSPLCNPLLIAVVLVLGVLTLSGLDLGAYQAGCGRISWLITPATISLAIPLYEQFRVLKGRIPAIAAGIAGGAVSSLLMILLFAALAGFENELTVSLLPKSVTTAIGVALSEMNGGSAAITTVAIMVTGISTNALSPWLFRLFRLRGRIARGVALGTAGHVIGTSKANELDPLTGAVSSLSLVTAGLITAVLFPLAMRFLG